MRACRIRETISVAVGRAPTYSVPSATASAVKVLVESPASGVAAYLAVRFLTGYFKTCTPTPFAIYCLAAGLGSLAWLSLR